MVYAFLLGALAICIWSTYQDRKEYEAFKKLTDTRDRQRLYRSWAGKSFLLFTVYSLLALVVLGRWDTLLTLPPEFASVAEIWSGKVSSDFVRTLILAVVAGLLAGSLVVSVLGRYSEKDMMLGDVAALLPRNAQERWLGLLLSANAGIGEELFFRLLLPLTLLAVLDNAGVPGSAYAAFGLSAVIFGLVHLYQGWVGVLSTTFLALLFSFIYLATGQIWVAMLIHFLIDFRALLLQPMLQNLFRRNRV